MFQLCSSNALTKRWANRLQTKALEIGKDRLTKQLDFEKLIRNSRSLTTLLRLLLSKQERRLLRF